MLAPSGTKSVVAWGAAALAAMLAGIVSRHGLGISGAENLIRWTARFSLVFFSASFLARGLSPDSWLARRGRGLFLTFALSHAFHAAAIALLAGLTDGENLAARGIVVVAGGGLGYAAIGLTAIRPESALSRWAVYWIWIVFFLAYLPRALQAPFVFGPALGLLLLAFLVRLRATKESASAP